MKSSSSETRLAASLSDEPTNHPAHQYALDVVEGRIPACDFIIRACKRYFRDIEQAESKQWYFDEEAAQKVIDFYGFVCPSQGEWAGKPLELLGWEQFILWNLFGWYKADGYRRFTEAYIAVPRKNGKSTFLAPIGLYMEMADNEPGAQVFTAASKRDQALIIWNEAVAMVKASPLLSKHLKCWQTAISHAASNSKFQALSSDDDTMSGLNTHCGLIDELHEHPNRKVYDILMTSTGARRQALIVEITTAGWNRQSICWTQQQYAEKVLKAVINDEGSDSFFAYIACLDKDAKWDDEREWYKANPSLGLTKKIDDMRKLASKAKEEPSSLNAFLRFHLNMWTQQESRFIPMDKWALCSGLEDPETDDPMEARNKALTELKGRAAIGALDLATVRDIAAYVQIFPPCGQRVRQGEEKPDPKDPRKKIREQIVIPPDDKWRVLPWFFIPQDNIEQRCKRDKVPYDVWVREGWMTATPGNVIDYEFIRQRIKSLGTEYLVSEIAFDPYNSTNIVTNLKEVDGFNMVLFRQGDISMNMPTKELLRLVLTGGLVHYNNPVLRWMADNLVVVEGATGLIKPDKEKSIEKIDGIVATIMALGRAQAQPTLPEFDAAHAIEVW